MIPKNELERIATVKGLTLQNCEKDYFQDVVLFTLYRIVGREFVFKGGTCLYKVYQLNRFSEDLDFTVTKRIDINKIMRQVLYSAHSLNIGMAIRELKQFQNQINIRLACRGPLYTGTKESMLIVLLNLSSRQKAILPPQKSAILPAYKEIPLFEVFAMDEDEIVIEKIRTVLERNQPRDVYDLWFLLKIKKRAINQKVLRKKTGRELEKPEFMRKVEEKAPYWEPELKRFILGKLPPFSQVKEEIEQCL